MSYANVEESLAQGAPVELYRFSRAGAEWLYTSADSDVIHGGDTYSAAYPISRGSVSRSADVERAELTVSAPRDFPVALLFRQSPPSDVIALTVHRLHTTDGDAEAVLQWAGRVLSVSWAGSECTLQCEEVSTSMRSPGLRLVWSRQCTLPLYSTRCGLNREAYASQWTVTGISGKTATLMPVVEPGEAYGDVLLSYLTNPTNDRLWDFTNGIGSVQPNAIPVYDPISDPFNICNTPVWNGVPLAAGDNDSFYLGAPWNDYVKKPSNANQFFGSNSAISFMYRPESFDQIILAMGSQYDGTRQIIINENGNLVLRSPNSSVPDVISESVMVLRQAHHIFVNIDPGSDAELFINGVSEATGQWKGAGAAGNFSIIGQSERRADCSYPVTADGYISWLAVFGGRNITGATVGILSAAAFGDAPSWGFAGGYLSVDVDGLPEMVSIRSWNRPDATLVYMPSWLEVGQTVTMYPGCDHTMATCNVTFSNIDNYGGAPWIPPRSPFAGSIF